MENQTQQKTPNYLKRISTLEHNVAQMKKDIEALQTQIKNILNVLKRK